MKTLMDGLFISSFWLQSFLGEDFNKLNPLEWSLHEVRHIVLFTAVFSHLDKSLARTIPSVNICQINEWMDCSLSWEILRCVVILYLIIPGIFRPEKDFKVSLVESCIFKGNWFINYGAKIRFFKCMCITFLGTNKPKGENNICVQICPKTIFW